MTEMTRFATSQIILGHLGRMKENLLGAFASKARLEQGWKMISMAVDSGACETVANPEEMPGYEVTETTESKKGINFCSATGEEIPNLGEMTIPMITRESSVRSMRICAAPVAMPLASVKKMCTAGHMVVFDSDGSYIMNKQSGEINQLREHDGNYMLDVMVPPPDHPQRHISEHFLRQP